MQHGYYGPPTQTTTAQVYTPATMIGPTAASIGEKTSTEAPSYNRPGKAGRRGSGERPSI